MAPGAAVVRYGFRLPPGVRPLPPRQAPLPDGVTCPACGERNEYDGSSCRSCGAPRSPEDPSTFDVGNLDLGGNPAAIGFDDAERIDA